MSTILMEASPRYLRVVRRIHLRCDNSVYVNDFYAGLFPIRVDYKEEHLCREALSVLKKLPCLKSLELYFFSTIDPL